MKTQFNLIKLGMMVFSISLLASCAKEGAVSTDETNGLFGNNIVGGVNMTATLQKEAGVVGIVIVAEDGTGICSGSLIAKRIVLTAAHCLDESESKIQKIFVIFSPNIETAQKTEMRSGVTGVAHELFAQSSQSDTTSWNDVALIKLDSDAPADFKLARLPSATQVLNAGTKVTQAGFGKAEATRNPTTDTSGVLRKVDGIALIKKSADGKELLFKENGKGSCNGDSGGPAYVRATDGKLTQVGLDSRGTSSTSCLGTGIYTNVSSHLDWIKRNSDKLLTSTATGF